MNTEPVAADQVPGEGPRIADYMPEEIPKPDFTSEQTGSDGTGSSGADEPKDKPKTNLGQNTRRASGVRQLSQKDIKALHSMYGSLALTLSLIHPKGAQAIAQNSEACVDAWVELSKQNDAVRRAILAALEGSAWSAVISAHLPIALAFVPENALERMPMLFGAVFSNDEVYDEGEAEE